MSMNVSYGRGEGGYTLTSTELAHLSGLRDALRTITLSVSEDVRATPGAGQEIYEYLLGLISFQFENNHGVPGGERHPKPGVDHAVFGWIEGALRVNGGEGFFADFIREIEGTSGSNVIDLSGTVVMGIELIDGREGNDNITGNDGDDIIIGGSGRDMLKGMGGDDIFYLFHSDSEYDSVNGGDGFDRMLGEFGNEIFRFHNFSGENTVELIDGGGGFNQIAGTDGSNVLDFSNTTLVNITQIMGFAGNDHIKGSAGNDVIYGGAGQDTVSGGAGDDRYWFSVGDGNDTIDNRAAGAADNDVLYIDDGTFDLGNLFFSNSGGDLLITIFSSNESIRIKGALQSEEYRLDQIIHEDVVLHADAIDELVSALAGFVPESGTEFSEAQRIEIVGVISTFFEPPSP